MIQLSLAEVAAAIGGQLIDAVDGDLLVTGSVETDSRLIKPGALFFAKPGEVTDGHNFVGSAAEAGAVAAVVEHEVTDGKAATLPQIVVADSVVALGLLARNVLERVRRDGDIRVIGITGSNGKTTTKNMLRAVLSTQGPTVAPQESFNNEVGAPISVLKIDRDTRYLVAELGAGGVGSVAYLARLFQPDVAVELKVGMAHAGEFGGIDTTAAIKAELLHHCAPNALAVLNADDGYVRTMAEDFQGEKVWFGTSTDAPYRAENLGVSLAGTGFDLHWPEGDKTRVTLRILGEHHVMNALASIAVADRLGVPREAIIGALEELPLAERWRMELSERTDGITVINDAYNASPDSTRAALQTLAQLGRQTGRRTVAIIGEMAELGKYSVEEHDALGRLAVRLNLDRLVAVGNGAKQVHMGACLEGSYNGESQFFESITEAESAIRGMLEPGDIVLVKSSKSANLRHLGDRLLEVTA